MLHAILTRGASVAALTLALQTLAFGQETLPTIDIGAGGQPGRDAGAPAKADPTAYAATQSSTATKTDAPILKTPYSVQVVPSQVLIDQQATRVEDAVKNVSGVQVPWSGGQYQDFVIRGFGTNTTRFRNGIRLPANNFDLVNVDRVEVLKGPAAMLYGRTEPGGMVNIVTKRPESVPSYYLQQQFGNYDYYRTTFGATGPATQDGSVLYRFDGSYLDAGSFRGFIHDRRVFLAPSVTWRPTAEDEFNVNFEYQYDTVPYDNGVPALYGQVANVPISRNYSNPGITDKFDSRLIEGSWVHRFDNSWTGRVGALMNWTDYQFDELPVGYFQGNLENTLDPTVFRGAYFENFHRRALTTYGYLTGKFDTGPLSHEVLLGSDYFVQRTTTYGFANFMAVNEDWSSVVSLYNPVYPARPYDYLRWRRQNAPNDFGELKDEWASVYFQDQISFGDFIHVMGGGRYDWSISTSGFAGRPVVIADMSLMRRDQFSPKAGVVLTPLPFISVYGSYSEGFGSNNFGRSVSGGVLPPETSQQWEWGVKSELFDKRLVSTLAFYQLTKQNVGVLAGDGSSMETKGEARSRGIELDVAGKVTDALSVIATFALTDARYTKVAIGDDHLGHRLPGAPTTAGSIWAKYEFQDGPLRGLGLGAGLYASGDRAGDKGYSPLYYSIPGYARVDLMAAYKFEYLGQKITAQLNIDNVNNVRYFMPCLPYNCSKAYNGVGAPLIVKGALRVDF
jgi:iron complex outermembrane receptor protein